MAQTAQERKAAQRRVAKGANPIAGMGKLSRRVASTRNGPKATETDHLRQDQFRGSTGGKHRAQTAGVFQNHPNPSYKSRHNGTPENYVGRHRGVSDHFRDLTAVIKRGGTSMGKHSKSWI
jgi:hypothetical protein